MQIKAIRCHLTLTIMASIQQQKSVGEDMEKLETFALLV